MAGAELTWPWPGRKKTKVPTAWAEVGGTARRGGDRSLLLWVCTSTRKSEKIAVLTYVQYIEKNVHVMIM
jgi:hypothetical protein